MPKQQMKAQRPGGWDTKGKLRIGLNGYTLTGDFIDGKWRFVCKDFPHIGGFTTLTRASGVFLALASRR